MASHHSSQCDVRQYKDQINLLEQRNMTLKAKTERLERELRVMGDRLKTIETRNKDFEAANREEWVRSYLLTVTIQIHLKRNSFLNKSRAYCLH